MICYVYAVLAIYCGLLVYIHMHLCMYVKAFIHDFNTYGVYSMCVACSSYTHTYNVVLYLNVNKTWMYLLVFICICVWVWVWVLNTIYQPHKIEISLLLVWIWHTKTVCVSECIHMYVRVCVWVCVSMYALHASQTAFASNPPFHTITSTFFVCAYVVINRNCRNISQNVNDYFIINFAKTP